jgi:hypothetical protein
MTLSYRRTGRFDATRLERAFISIKTVASSFMESPKMEVFEMIRRLGIASLLALSVAAPIHEAAAQDTLGGAILGGAGGAIIGGALGGGRGAAIGAVLGAGTGAAIAADGERRRGGYYYYQNGCYLQRGDGAWVRVHPRYC